MEKAKHFNTPNKQPISERFKGKSKHNKPKEYYPNENPIYCKSFGCDRRLKPIETLYGEYCFNCSAIRNKKERERLKLVTPNASYIAKKFRWSALNNNWEAVKTIELTVEQFTMYIHTDDYNNDNSNTHYRYDIYVNTANADIIYSYNPNLYD